MGKIMYSDFFECYFVIYKDLVTGRFTTKRCGSYQEADTFRDSLSVGIGLWYNKD